VEWAELWVRPIRRIENENEAGESSQMKKLRWKECELKKVRRKGSLLKKVRRKGSGRLLQNVGN